MKRGSRGQIKISFGMIFSIILIVIFLVFAFYAIRTFMGIQESAQVGKFLNDFESDIDTMWKSTEGSREREYRLPTKIKMVCFIDRDNSAQGEEYIYLFSELRFAVLDDNNMVFYPVGSASPESVKIENIALKEIIEIEKENPFCIENKKGVLRMTLVKEFRDALVRIKR